MKMQRSLICQLMLYEFEWSHITTEVIQNICCQKGEGVGHHCCASLNLLVEKKFTQAAKILMIKIFSHLYIMLLFFLFFSKSTFEVEY